jgi:hypothetical protein
MSLLWFLLGYGIASYWAHREQVEHNLVAIEDYANYDRDKH